MNRVDGIRLLLAGGLGNQLFQYAACRALSLERGCPLELDLRFFLREHEYSPAYFRAYQLGELAIHARTTHLRDKAHGAIRRLWRRFVVEPPSIRYASDRVGFDPRFLRLSPPLVVSAGLQSAKYFEHHAQTIREELCPDVWLDDAAQSMLERIESSASTAVHVRRTDFALYHGSWLERCAGYYRRALESLDRAVPNSTLFVFSDDIGWCRESGLFDRFDTCYVSFPDGATSPGRELALMSRCAHHVIANSSFSWWGAWLAEHDGQHVFAPRAWAEGVDALEACVIPAKWKALHAGD